MGAEMSMHQAGCMPSEDWLDFIEQETTTPSVTRESSSSCGMPTLIVFDWDDTLLCSTAVRRQAVTDAQLQQLERSIAAVLATATSLGETLIITNGNRTWVQDSARRFLPGLVPLLSQITIVSARALYQDVYPDDPFMWKRAAFEQLFTQERHFPSEPGLNLVALGDQFPELDAAHHVVQLVGGCSVVKTVKFQEAPSANELIGQIGRVDQSLCLIAEARQSQSYSVVQCAPSCFENMTSTAAAWKCSLHGAACEIDDGSAHQLSNLKHDKMHELKDGLKDVLGLWI